MKNISKILIVIAIFFLTIGAAAISGILYINGNVTIGTNADDWDIYFSSAIVDGVDKSNKIISPDRKKITYTIPQFKYISDKIVLEYEITNNSSLYDASVNVIIKVPDNVKKVLRITNELDDSIFYAKTSRNGTLTLELFNQADEEIDCDLEIDIVVSAVERTSIATEEFDEKMFSIGGYLLDGETPVASKKIVIVSNNEKQVVETDRYGYFYVELDRGLHEIYYPQDEDVDELTIEYIKNHCYTSFEVSTSQSGTLNGTNGYKISEAVARQVDNRIVNITLNPNGGTVSNNVITKTENNYYRYIEEPHRDNYDFAGWYLNDKLIEDDVYVVGRDAKELTAKWEPKKYTLTFIANGGTLTGDDTKVVQVGSPYGEFPTVTKTDYRFTGWYTVGKTSAPYDENEFKEDDIVDITQNETLYAQWAKQCDLFPYAEDNVLYHIVGNKSLGTDVCNGIDYSTTNGRGVFTLDSTRNDTYPVHFFRENTNYNYVKMGKFCFRIVRTTDNGGVRVIYNGLYNETNGTCKNVGDDVLIIPKLRYQDYILGVSYDQADNAYVGYKYGEIKVNDYNRTHANTNTSDIKLEVEKWYAANLLSYNSYIDDSVYCNDRTVVKSNTWSSYKAGYNQRDTFYAGMERLYLNRTPSLTCERALDRFTRHSSDGNGELTYKVGLLTADEASYGGLVWNTRRVHTYLWTQSSYWTMTPNSFYGEGPRVFVIKDTGALDTDWTNKVDYGVRPVITFIPGTVVLSGTGYEHDPFIIAE